MLFVLIMCSRKVPDWLAWKNSSLPVTKKKKKKIKERLWLGFLINYVCMIWFLSYLIQKRSVPVSNLAWINYIYSSFKLFLCFHNDVPINLQSENLETRFRSSPCNVNSEAWRWHLKYHSAWLLHSWSF